MTTTTASDIHKFAVIDQSDICFDAQIWASKIPSIHAAIQRGDVDAVRTIMRGFTSPTHRQWDGPWNMSGIVNVWTIPGTDRAVAVHIHPAWPDRNTACICDINAATAMLQDAADSFNSQCN